MEEGDVRVFPKYRIRFVARCVKYYIAFTLSTIHCRRENAMRFPQAEGLNT